MKKKTLKKRLAIMKKFNLTYEQYRLMEAMMKAIAHGNL